MIKYPKRAGIKFHLLNEKVNVEIDWFVYYYTCIDNRDFIKEFTNIKKTGRIMCTQENYYLWRCNVQKIFLSSHGRLASGMKSSVDILLGDSENITVFDAYVDQRSVAEQLEQFYETVTDQDKVFLLSDLHCGSVNQAMYSFLDRPNTTVITGINLSLVLELVSREDITQEEIDEIIALSREMLHVVREDSELRNDEDFY